MRKIFLTFMTTILLLTMNSCSFLRGTGSTTTDNGSLCLNYANSQKSQLEVGLIHEMTGFYQDGLIVDDTHAVRLDLETLKKFVYHLEMEAKKNNVESKDLGVRIYFGRYPKKSTWNDLFSRDLSVFLNDPITEKYEEIQTIVMIPTLKIDTIHYDFNPLDSSTYTSGSNGNPAYFPTTENPFPSQLFFGLSITKSTTNAQNHGQVYPPHTNIGRSF